MSHRTKLATLKTFNVQKAANAKCFNCKKVSHMKKQCTCQYKQLKIIPLLKKKSPQEFAQNIKRDSIS